MFEIDHSAARGMMCPRRLIVFKHDSEFGKIVFKHDSEFGNAPSFQLFDLVHVVQKDPSKPARSFSDYEVKVDDIHLPNGVQLIDML